MKGAAMFYVDFLVEHPTLHYLVVSPDMSPENAPAAHQGSSTDAGTTMTNQIVFRCYSVMQSVRQRSLHQDVFICRFSATTPEASCTDARRTTRPTAGVARRRG